MIGFAASPGMAVLPMCSVDPTSQGANACRSTAASSAKSPGHDESYATISTGVSSDAIVSVWCFDCSG